MTVSLLVIGFTIYFVRSHMLDLRQFLGIICPLCPQRWVHVLQNHSPAMHLGTYLTHNNCLFYFIKKGKHSQNREWKSVRLNKSEMYKYLGLEFGCFVLFCLGFFGLVWFWFFVRFLGGWFFFWQSFIS